MERNPNLSILKSFWVRRADGRWAIHDMKEIVLTPKEGFAPDYFAFEFELTLMTSTPPRNVVDLFSSFGSTDYLLKQSIVPVVALVPTENVMRCIGTAFIVSASGYVVTASHVLLDPKESGYGKFKKIAERNEGYSGMTLGVIIPVNPARGVRAFEILPIEKIWYWGEWEESPLIHEPDKLNSLTDVAVAKLPERSDGAAYQPLNLSLHPFKVGEGACAIGYAEMPDVPIEYVDGKLGFPHFGQQLFVSFGVVTAVYPANYITKEVPTPGPSFDFEARIPGKMSGAPIFGGQGAVVRGVVSSQFSRRETRFRLHARAHNDCSAAA